MTPGAKNISAVVLGLSACILFGLAALLCGKVLTWLAVHLPVGPAVWFFRPWTTDPHDPSNIFLYFRLGIALAVGLTAVFIVRHFEDARRRRLFPILPFLLLAAALSAYNQLHFSYMVQRPVQEAFHLLLLWLSLWLVRWLRMLSPVGSADVVLRYITLGLLVVCGVLIPGFSALSWLFSAFG